MHRVLVAYATNAGSTAEVAEVVGEVLAGSGVEVEVRGIEEITEIGSFAAVVVGAPMIMGWHREAVGFVKKHRRDLAAQKVGYFMTALSMTQVPHHLEGISVAVDPALAKAPKKGEGRLSFKERFATVDEYVGPVLRAVPEVAPVGVGVFGGKLDPSRLKWWQRIFVTRIIGARPGEYRNWPFIREWAARLASEIARSGGD